MSTIKEKLNFNIDENYTKYFFKQFVFIMINLFIFFLISYYYFSFIVTLFFMWVAIVISILYLYLDLKFNYRLMDNEKRIKNLEYIVGKRK